MAKKRAPTTKQSSADGRTSDALGQKAQAKIASWASDVDAVPNPSTVDRGGWDFIVSFPSENEPSTDLFDVGAVESSCYLQVKATAGKRRRCQVSVGNWRRAISGPHPFFFVILEYAGREPVDAFVVHVDAALSEQVAKRLWEKPRAKLDLVWGEAERVTCNADGVFGRIRALIGPDYHSYVDEKLATWRAISSESSELHIRMPGAGDADDVAKAEWAVGIADELPISSYQHVQTRFGIQRFHPPKDGEGGDLTAKMERVPTIGSATLNIASGAESVTLDCDVYSSNLLFPRLPEKAIRVRLATRFLSLVLAKDVAPIVRLSIDAHEPARPVAELAAHAKALRLLARGATIQVTMSDESTYPKPMDPTVLLPLEGQDLSMVEEIAVFERLLLLHQRAGLDVDTTLVQPGTILGRKPEEIATLDLVAPGVGEADLVFPGAEGTFDASDEVAAVLITDFRAGEYHFLLGAVLRGALVPVGSGDMRLAAVPYVADVRAVKRDESRARLTDEARAMKAAVDAQLLSDGVKWLIDPSAGTAKRNAVDGETEG